MTLRGKLVRDRIPEIIVHSGSMPMIEIALPEDHAEYVRAKLQEELQEYLTSGDVAELADVIEVCFAAAALAGLTPGDLRVLVREKHAERGGFDKRFVWLGNSVSGEQP